MTLALVAFMSMRTLPPPAKSNPDTRPIEVEAIVLRDVVPRPSQLAQQGDFPLYIHHIVAGSVEVDDFERDNVACG
jgi:hypothetical protein